MEDPWGDPWTTDTPVKLDLPAAPRQAHFAAVESNSSPRRVSPDAASPWNDDDNAWGGWNDAGAGKESPAWGRSPGLKPLGGAVLRQPSPDPWGGPGTVEEQEVEKRRDERTADSAISLGEEGARRDDALDAAADGKLPKVLVESAQDVWGAEERTLADATAPSTAIEESERSKSPDIVPGPAVRAIDQSEASRQPTKVQELVEMYDGIAKKGVSSTETPFTATKSSISARANDDAAPEIEFTKVQQEGLAEAALKGLAEETTDEKHPVTEAVGELETTAIPDDQQIDALQQTMPKPPQIPYPIDLSKLDDLFPSTPAMSTKPEHVPDVIINDSFTTVSERKAWYHISRFGSIRQHNGGDDEGYVRIGWAGSKVREQTHKIVRRWMEEDSIGGRVVLGRRLGVGGASMFNWDSEAPPVEIGELLKRKGATHSRQVSASVKGSEAAFSWSSSLPASPTIAVAPAPAGALQKESTSSETRQSVSERPASLQLPGPPKSAPTTTASMDRDDTDDDDWGEMVSSPAVPASSFDMSLSAEMDSKETTTVDAGHRPSQGDALDIATKTSSMQATTVESQITLSDQSNPCEVAAVKPPTPQAPMRLTSNHPTKPAIGSTAPLPPTSSITMKTPSESTHAASEPRASQDDEVITTILCNLPDLSYMLR
ncbi:hypothetical protein TOPH_01536 [Tolypocladium ophioglossoides CBS 100239]|uniref:Uncharacterized protein n=1 Tax=Tolypocladium ophioglossoides (strain CBS 100239) TaxID=1163406 RepID=A0A0L0NHR7_TOLOC|nr:hypothetical protein TOPH_01536 [Tolypocladium ophioglossoides CBS 100239]